METDKILPDFAGACEMRSDYTLDDLADIISDKVFNGVKFGGKEKSIHEEIPAIFIQQSLFGLLIILEGYSGIDNWFVLSVQPYVEFNRYLRSNNIQTERVDLDLYLYHLLKQGLQDYPEISIIQPDSLS